MDKLLPTLYADYGKYVNEFRAFPSILDGSKVVEKRLLYSLYETGRDKLVKSAKVVGKCIGDYHPHGDTSAYNSLVGLVQNGFVIGQGNWGNSAGVNSDPPAAYRYTECKFHKDTLDLAFEYIKHVPHEIVETDDPEPLFLPTKLPICLLGNSFCQGIGFGYRTMIPCYTKLDLIKRLKWLVSDKKGKEPIIKPITDCKILSDDIELKKLLTTGHTAIKFEGKISKVGKKEILVESVSPSRAFKQVLEKLSKEIEKDKSVGVIDESTTTTKVRFAVLKPRMIKQQQLYDKVKQLITGSVTFQCHVVNTHGKVVLLSVDDILMNVYKVYLQITTKVLKHQSLDTQMAIDELNLIALIKPLLSTELKTNPDNLDLVITNISKKLKKDKEVIKSLFDKYTLSRIFKVKTDTQQLMQRKKMLDHNIENVSDYVWKEKYS
jgi:DNA gyrase/topoisomerase IV subunit A